MIISIFKNKYDIDHVYDLKLKVVINLIILFGLKIKLKKKNVYIQNTHSNIYI